MDPKIFPANFWICPEKISQKQRRNCLKRNQQINSPKIGFLSNFHLNRSSWSWPHLTNFIPENFRWASLGYAAICPERGSIEIHTTQWGDTGTNDTSGLETPLDPSWSVGDKPQCQGAFLAALEYQAWVCITNLYQFDWFSTFEVFVSIGIFGTSWHTKMTSCNLGRDLQ